MRLFSKRKNRAPGPQSPRPDPRALIAAQSLRGATVGAILASLLLAWLWLQLTLLTGRVFPWFSIIQGVFVGLAVRRFGHGIDWRFPLVAAVVAWIGAFLGNFLIAIPTTAEELGVSQYRVIRGITWWSVELFFAEVITVVDYIYAFCAVAVATFFSKRHLSRYEHFALRTYKERQ